MAFVTVATVIFDSSAVVFVTLVSTCFAVVSAAGPLLSSYPINTDLVSPLSVGSFNRIPALLWIHISMSERRSYMTCLSVNLLCSKRLIALHLIVARCSSWVGILRSS